MDAKEVTLHSGGARGAETVFGECAEACGMAEVNYTFDGHHINRKVNTKTLTADELAQSDVVMSEVSKLLHRDYSNSPWMRQILQSIQHQVNNGFQVFIVGVIQSDGTVKGGTGWAAEQAKLYNRPLHVFDQDKNDWFTWRNDSWVAEVPVISHKTICGTGTRSITDAGEKAIKDLFERSFGA